MDNAPSEICSAVHDLLYDLGVTAKYIGFFYTSYAVYLAIQQPERLLLVTKWLYPDVARQYHTSWCNVEKNIRFVISVAWELRPHKLFCLAKHELIRRPSNSQFITMLAKHIQTEQTAHGVIDPIAQIS